MPNYSQNTKLTLATADEPPYLTVGTDVSAKYKGAFCEAKIIDVNKHVKLRVLFDGHPGSYMIDDSEVKQGSPLEIGSKIEARHPEKKQQIYTHATITKILDQSRYTVVFDDGDQCILRRNSICLKSGKHFAESETLDQLPLTNPEHFGNPVKVGQASPEHNNHNNSTNQSQQTVSNQSTNKLGNNSSNNTNSGNSNSVGSKNGLADLNSQTSSATNSNAKGQSKTEKLETEKSNRGKSNASTSSNINNTPTTTCPTTGPPGRRGGGKGRKRRESTTSNAKQSSELDEELDNDSQDSAEVEVGESDINLASIEIGVKLMVQYGKGKVQNVYEAKVNKIETSSSGKTRYLVHYTGWNNRYDEWITKNRILSVVTERENCTKDNRSRQSEPNSTNATSSSSSGVSSDPITNRDSLACKDKDKEKDNKPSTKTPRRSRQADATSTNNQATVSDEPNSSSIASSVAPATVIVTGTKVAVTPSRERDRDRDKDEEKEVPPKTRRSRLPADSSNSAISTSSPISTTTTTEVRTPIKHEDDIKEEVKRKDDRSKDKDLTSTPNTKSGRPRSSDSLSCVSNLDKAQASSIKPKEKEPLAKTRRSRHAETANSITAVPVVTSEVPKIETTQQIDREKTKEAHQSSKEIRSTKQSELVPQLINRSSGNLPLLKDKEFDKEQISVSTKTRGSRQTENRSSICQSSLTPTTVSSSSASSICSSSTSTTTTINQLTTASSTSIASSVAATSDSISVTASQNSSRERERDREKERDKDRERDKEPPIKIRRSRQITSDSSGNTSAKDSGPTNATVNAATTTTTTTASCTSAASSTSSTASSSVSSSYAMSLMNSDLSALASLSEKEREKFDDLPVIDEPDCDKRISILQDKIMTIRQTYMALKAELADLDRRRKRPRIERSNSDHINLNSGVTCRN